MLRGNPIASFHDDPPRDPSDPYQRDAMDAQAIIRFLRRWRWVYLLWLALGLSLGLAYAILTPAYYTASASILLQDPAARTPTALGSGADAHSTYVETQVQIFVSDEVLGRVVDNEHLTADPEFGGVGGLRDQVVPYVRPILKPESQATIREPRYATITRVRRALSVRRVGTSDVVNIQFTARSSERSADLANAVITAYKESLLDAQQDVRQETLTHFQVVLSELRNKAFPVESAEEASNAAAESGSEARARFRERQDTTNAYRELYGRVLQRELDSSEAEFAPSEIRVITPADAPLFPTSRVVIFMAFTCLGGFVGFSHALLKQLTDHRLRNVEDVQRTTGVSRVSRIGRVDTKGRLDRKAAPVFLQPAYRCNSVAIHQAAARVGIGLRDQGARRGGWIIGVAGPTRASGVYTIAAHLARAIAETGQRTLLLDANWRKPTLGQALLSASESRKLARGVVSIHLDGETLDVLTLRATAPISELNASLSIVSALELMRAEYDCIVVDFLSTEDTVDVQAAAEVIDQLVVVALAARTTAGDLRGFLRQVPADRVAAVILNKA